VFQREQAGDYSGLGAVVGALLLVGVALAGLVGVEVIPARFDPVFRYGGLVARAERLQGRLFNNFIWGISCMPGRSRRCSRRRHRSLRRQLFDEYVQVWNLEPGWRMCCVGEESPAVIPPRSRLAEEPDRPGWKVWYCDSTAAVLQAGWTPPGPADPIPHSPCSPRPA
jgi:hypothetical protein